MSPCRAVRYGAQQQQLPCTLHGYMTGVSENCNAKEIRFVFLFLFLAPSGTLPLPCPCALPLPLP